MSATETSEVIGTITLVVRGQEIPVNVTDEGVFTATLDDQEVVGDSIREIERRCHNAIMASKIEVPFVTQNGHRGVMRGFHASQSKVLVTWANGDKGGIENHEKVWPADKIDQARIDDIKATLIAIAQLRERLDTLRGDDAVKVEHLFADAVGEELVGR